ncbi:MAG: hypothetical protein ABIJ46_03745 [bacterium]
MDNSINEILKEACLIDCRCDRNSKDEDLLGIHESVTKLWSVVRQGRDREDIERRAANTVIGCLITAGHLGIKDMEGVLRARIEELKKELA